MANEPIGELVYLEWLDARGANEQWDDLNRFRGPHNKPAEIQSVGWIVAEDDDCLSIVAHLDADEDLGCGILTVLKVCIKVLKNMIIPEATARRKRLPRK